MAVLIFHWAIRQWVCERIHNAGVIHIPKKWQNTDSKIQDLQILAFILCWRPIYSFPLELKDDHMTGFRQCNVNRNVYQFWTDILFAMLSSCFHMRMAVCQFVVVLSPCIANTVPNRGMSTHQQKTKNCLLQPLIIGTICYHSITLLILINLYISPQDLWLLSFHRSQNTMQSTCGNNASQS